ncbi:glycosyltransferase family 8 protein [Paenibacillus zanthoxyli]|uniref:glycosyltransferase family 8 protein n=1 Tax=Paenibacillus zanthoxyli TaxID=369399 RepID=UPI00046FDB10|nr:glycosyltransferase family 8 protein [Paenibacillus zanthoxyli]
MIELVLTINDRDGRYTEHAGVVLASIFSNTQQSINVHIVHDGSLSDENKFRLTQLVESFHHNIFYYYVTLPGDFLEVAAGVHKIDYWTVASMYRLLLPQFIPADRVIYLDCDILVNMDINQLWSIDLGERYLGAVLDQGGNLLEYFTSLGLNAELYFNSGVILFHLNNIRNRQTWYDEMLGFMRTFPWVTMPDQDVLNALYGSNYLQLDLRFNSFGYPELDLENRIVHFAGDSKWWNEGSHAAPLYYKYLAMTPWSKEFIQVPVSGPEPVNIPLDPPPLPQEEPSIAPPKPINIPLDPSPLPQEKSIAPPAPVNIPLDPPPLPQEEQPIAPPAPPAPKILVPAPPVIKIPVPQAEAPGNIPVKPHRRKRRRSIRLWRRLRLRKKMRLRRRLRKIRIFHAKYRSSKQVKLLKRKRAARSKIFKSAKKKLQPVRKNTKSHTKRPLKRTS